MILRSHLKTRLVVVVVVNVHRLAMTLSHQVKVIGPITWGMIVLVMPHIVGVDNMVIVVPILVTQQM